MKICKDRPIGKVIYVVEGERTEVLLLKHIFVEIFSFTFVESKRNGEDILHFKSGVNKGSQIYVIVGKRPQVVGLTRDIPYLEETYNRLNYEFRLEPLEAALYYIFDRDRESNPAGLIRSFIGKLKNSRDNGSEMNGALLISYPCIESYLVNAKENEAYHGCGKEIKSYVYHHKYFIEDLTEEDLVFATEVLLRFLKRIRKKDLQSEELDDLSGINASVFNSEEQKYFKDKVYFTLSLLGLSFLDLGLIVEE